jgi:hypothetical protein
MEAPLTNVEMGGKIKQLRFKNLDYQSPKYPKLSKK